MKTFMWLVAFAFLVLIPPVGIICIFMLLVGEAIYSKK